MAENNHQIIGKYEILEKLGEGGFGIVYKANDTSLDRIVALKQLKMELSSSPEYLDRFKRESRSMGSLNHPNIVKMLEVFEDAGRYFIVMDYMPNGSLADKLKDGKVLSLDETVEILKPIAKAIDYAHSKNLIHRDIKPSNILFMEGDEPVLSDFGLVKSLDTKGQTTTGVSFGTPEYMAPEQILGKELTPASDLYALGIVAFQMLTGRVPFTGNTPFEIEEGHVHKELPSILERNITLPKGLHDMFCKILAKNPEDRFTSAKEFLQEIKQENDLLIQEQSKEKLIQVQKYINDKEFSSAITMLSELIAFKSSTELREMLKECQRREQVWKEYQQLKKQASELNDKLTNISTIDKWVEDKIQDEILKEYTSPKEGSKIEKSQTIEMDQVVCFKGFEKIDPLPEGASEPKTRKLKILGWVLIIAGIISLLVGLGMGAGLGLWFLLGIVAIGLGTLNLIQSNTNTNLQNE
jgi:serine/threonine protein kinase